VAAVGGAGLQGYLVRRILLALPVLVGVSLLVFGVMRLAPGDPAAIMLGAQATREDVERLRRDLGLDRPVAVQYAQWMGRVLRGDLGRSIPLGREVLPEVLLRFKATVVLTAGALVIAIAVGLTAGIVSATRQYSWLDKLSMAVAVTGVSLPVFWTGIMLILVFALSLRWFPSAGMVSPYGGGLDDLLWHLALPALTLGTASAAAVARLTRSSVLEIIRQDYVRSARAKGLAERAVIARHVLKNAINPIITVLGVQVGEGALALFVFQRGAGSDKDQPSIAVVQHVLEEDAGGVVGRFEIEGIHLLQSRSVGSGNIAHGEASCQEQCAVDAPKQLNSLFHKIFYRRLVGQVDRLQFEIVV